MKKLYEQALGAEEFEDVPYVQDKKNYKTYMPLEEDDEIDKKESSIPDTSVILPKKIEKKKKVLVEPPPEEDINDDSPDFETFQEFMNSMYEQVAPTNDLVNQNVESNINKKTKPIKAPSDPAAMGVNDPTMTDPNGEQDLINQTIPGGEFGGTSPMDAGASYASGQHSAGEIGRIYELKRIYNRLLTLEEYLSFSADDKLLNLKQHVATSIEFFELIVSNIDTFLDKIDDIIVMYYDFLRAMYKILKAYLELTSKKDGETKK